MSGTRTADAATVTIRFADSLDGRALAALAQLDSAEQLRPPVLLAESAGQLRAALSLTDGRAIADPFRPTAELVLLLRTRARQLAHEPGRPVVTRLRAPLRRVRAMGLESHG